ncbi:hypothetical protein ABH11_01552 [Serratia marcescens]|nr:hypothetical protein ABH11_01552 [Serratia marcescens]
MRCSLLDDNAQEFACCRGVCAIFFYVCADRLAFCCGLNSTIDDRKRLAFGVGASSSWNVEENARGWMECNNPIISLNDIIYGFAAQVVIVGYVKDRGFIAVYRCSKFLRGVIEEADRARGCVGGRGTFTMQLWIGEDTACVNYMFPVFSHFLLRHFAESLRGVNLTQHAVQADRG